MKDIFLISSDNICTCDLEREQWIHFSTNGDVSFPCEWRTADAKCYELSKEYLIWRLMRALTLGKEVL